MCAVCKRERASRVPFLVLQSPASSIEKASWLIASVALFIMMMSFGAAWITAVALKDIASEVGGTRSIPALASALVARWRHRRSGSKKHSEHTAYEVATPAAG